MPDVVKYPNARLVLSVARLHDLKLKPDTVALTITEACWYAEHGDVAGAKAVCPFLAEVELGDSTR